MTRRDAVFVSLGVMLMAGVYAAAQAVTAHWYENSYAFGAR